MVCSARDTDAIDVCARSAAIDTNSPSEDAVDRGVANRIHNCDQRTQFPIFMHPMLSRPLRLEQCGANTKGFAGTSSVAWPTAKTMMALICESPDLVRGLSVVEVGSGIGLVGATCAAVGARRTVLTDWEGQLPLLLRNQALLAEDGTHVEVHQLDWGSDSNHCALLEGTDGFDVVIGSDVCLGGFDTANLFRSCLALVSRRKSAKILIGYEHREEWETISTFIGSAEKAGLRTTFAPFNDDDEDLFFYKFEWRDDA